MANEALSSSVFVQALSTFGDFYSFTGNVFKQMFTRRFQFREFVSQAWFLTTVSFAPAILVAIPFCVVIIFQVNQLLIQIGAVDLAGAGAAVAVVREIGPIVSVLVVAGAGATAICADLDQLGIRLDAEKNAAAQAGETVISADDSPAKVMIIPTNEELVVAREVKRYLDHRRN